MSPGPRRHLICGGCDGVYLGEDNWRFIILVLILAAYLTMGTFVFYHLEQVNQNETNPKQAPDLWRNFTAKYAAVIDARDLVGLMEAYNYSLSHQPFPPLRQKLDLYQSFYLAFTACATIGFGHVVPTSTAARAVMIVYGLFGCSAIILFYNLFLERIITLLALVLRSVHEYKQRTKHPKTDTGRQSIIGECRRPSGVSRSSDDSLANWKPSVYWVMVCLFFLVISIALSASVLFSKMESWDYFTALYFSFVCFATVGFGDVVTAIQDDYGTGDTVYRCLNVLIIVVGTSSLYSLFNVISIIIKHGLNFIIKQVDQKCCKHCCRHLRQVQENRRNAIIPGSQSFNLQNMPAAIITSKSNGDAQDRCQMTPSGNDRRYSDDLEMDVREFLQANKVSLAIMQKDLYESANQRGRTTVSAPSWHHSRSAAHYHKHSSRNDDEDFTPGNIGPMAIVQHTLHDED